MTTIDVMVAIIATLLIAAPSFGLAVLRTEEKL